jgi:hypothetical protein
MMHWHSKHDAARQDAVAAEGYLAHVESKRDVLFGGI